LIPFSESASLGTARILVPDDLVAIILRLQHHGWQEALSDHPLPTTDHGEPFLNGRLYLGMEKVRIAWGLSNLYLHVEPGVGLTTHSPHPKGLPDISITITGLLNTSPHAIIECKRVDSLEKPKRLRSEYVVSGINRFIEGVYFTGGNVNFMFAYVVSGGSTEAMADINSYLLAAGHECCALEVSTEFELESLVAESRHSRDHTGMPFRILHSFGVVPRSR
jgi:hypothetical protein